MIKSTIELIKLTSADGMTLTNGEVFSKEIYLGCNDSPERLQAEAEGRGEDG